MQHRLVKAISENDKPQPIYYKEVFTNLMVSPQLSRRIWLNNGPKWLYANFKGTFNVERIIVTLTYTLISSRNLEENNTEQVLFQ